MKVTKIETFLCHAYRTNWVFVKVSTDAGIHGWGEATLETREKTVEQAILELERYLVGKDPHDIEAFWHDVYRDTYWRGGPVLMSAISGVEMALWDIKGKDLGVPVYNLLGGKVRESIPCYANGWFAKARSPEEFAAKATEVAKQGFLGLKWDPFGKAYMNISKKELKVALSAIAAVYKAVGDTLEIIIEAHGRFNVPSAIRIGQALEEFDILCLEEPIPPDNREGLLKVKKKVQVPIAAGERLYNRWDYNNFLQLGCADYIQPDISHVGGISELKKIAAMAESYYIPVCPHNPSGPVSNAATLHIAANLPNFYLLETMITDIPYRKDICDEKLVFDKGFIQIPTSPGLGIDINEKELENYPYQPTNLRHYDGNLTDIRPYNENSVFHLRAR